MYEDLVKRLREHGEFLIVSDRMKAPPNVNVRNVFAEDYAQAADAIEIMREAVATAYNELANVIQSYEERKPRWIPVAERLPDVFKHVLVNIPGMAPHPTVQEAFLEKNGMWYSNGFRYEADEITHWMQIPMPPKEET